MGRQQSKSINVSAAKKRRRRRQGQQPRTASDPPSPASVVTTSGVVGYMDSNDDCARHDSLEFSPAYCFQYKLPIQSDVNLPLPLQLVHHPSLIRHLDIISKKKEHIIC